MSTNETDIRDHDTDTDAFYAEVKRLREANAGKQADEMARVFGPHRINPDPNKPAAGGKRWCLQDVLRDG